jgi:hypothetical protein
MPPAPGVGNDVARAVHNGQHREHEQSREIERGPEPRRESQAEQDREQAEGKGAVALAERAGIVALSLNQRSERARHLGDDPSNHDQHHEHGVDARDEGEGQVKRSVGNDIRQLVQDGAGRTRLAMFLRHMPSMAFMPMRTNSVTGRSRSGHAESGMSASQAP